MCERLPWWDGWIGPGVALLLGGSLMLVAAEFCRRRAIRQVAAPNQHWSERARAAFEVRVLSMVVLTSCSVVFSYLTASWSSGTQCSDRIATPTVMAFGVLLVFALSVRTFGTIRVACTGSAATIGARLRSLATFFVVLRPSWVVVAAAALLSSEAPNDGRIWVWTLVLAVLLYAANTGIAYPLARPLGLARPASAAVVHAVERAQRELPTRVRGVDELAWLMPNALALPLLGRVAFTKAAADALNEEALYAIALHELAHLNEPRLVRWSRPVAALALLPLAVAEPLLRNDRALELLILAVASLFLSVLSLRVTRRLEHAADAHAAEHSPAYAVALETLHRLAGIPAVLSKRTTHPSLYDRMVAAGATPDYPRPRPPRMRFVWLTLASVPLWIFGLELAARPMRSVLASAAGDLAPHVRVSLGGRARDLLALAELERHDPLLRESLIDRALEESPDKLRVLREVARLRQLDCQAIRGMLAASKGSVHSANPRDFWQCR